MEPVEYTHMDKAEQGLWWYRALHTRLCDALTDTRGRVLDAGCGTGGFLAMLPSRHPDLTRFGIEWDETAALRARDKSGAEVVRGSVTFLPFADASFDAAISADVLCHAAVDPAAALAELKRILRPGGRLILNMPAYQWLFSAHDRQVHNVRRLTASTIAALLHQAGFGRVRARYWNGLLLPLMVVQRKILARGQAQSDVAPIPPWLDATLGGMTVFERRLPFPLPAGGSVLALAESHDRYTYADRESSAPGCEGHHELGVQQVAQSQVAWPPEAAAQAAEPQAAEIQAAAHLAARPGLSIVVPVYRGATTIGRLVDALSKLEPAGGLELVLVNDGSPDNSDDICRALLTSARIPLIYIEHARNYGEHNAIMTGLRHATGDFVITMDDDLQNPPEEVVRLYNHARDGNWDVVYTRYAVKQHDGWRNLGSRFANAVADRLLDKPRGLYLSSFRCMSAMVVRAVTRYSGPYPYVDGLVMQVTQRIDSIEVRHLPRVEGRSNYTLIRLVRLWLNLATSFSLAPLRLAIYAGLALSVLGAIGAVATIGEALFVHKTPSGWASTMVVLLLVSGVQSMILGVLGEYVGRTFLSANGKPQGTVRSVLRNTDPA